MIDKLFPLFIDRPEAWQFILLYKKYIHTIDDLVDEKFDINKLLYSYYLASLIYSSDYFYRNRATLLAIDHTISSCYADSVAFERAEGEQKKQWADTIRHCGIEMILKIVQIELGWEAMRSISPIVREEVLKS